MLPIMKWARGLFSDPRDAVQYRSVPGSDHDNRLESDKNTLSRSNHWLPSLLSLARLSVTGRVSLLLVLVLVVSVIFSTPSINEAAAYNYFSNSSSNFFHLLIPATSTGVGFCRNAFSAAVLNYPTPRMINWQMQPKGGDVFGYGGLHNAKISGTLDYLNTLGPESDQELVLMVDGFDMWFQLPPNILIDRYQRLLEQQNDGLRRRLGRRAMEKQDIRQTIIMAAENRCWPQNVESGICTVVPDSPLAHDIYGNRTDADPDWKWTRARWVNSGFIMGPVVDVRKLLNAVYKFVLHNPARGSDQASFNDAFAQQEFYRELVRKQSLSAPQRLLGRVNSMMGVEDERSKMVLSANSTLFPTSDTANSDDYEFHLGLDYLGDLTVTIDSRADHLTWHTHSRPEDAAKVSMDRGIPEPVRITSLPDDIAHSMPPFSVPKRPGTEVVDDEDDDAPRNGTAVLPQQPWSDVPLYTQLYTGVVPATLHFNRPKENMDKDWDKLWMYSHLRDLLSARVLAPRTPVAVIPERPGYPRQLWWSSIDSKGGMVGENGSAPVWVSWEEGCSSQEMQDKVFRDQRGPWVDPRSPPVESV